MAISAVSSRFAAIGSTTRITIRGDGHYGEGTKRR